MNCLRVCYLSLFGLLTFPCYAAVYEWTDAQGVTHFSDIAKPGAVAVQVAPAQTYPATSSLTSSMSSISSVQSATSAAIPVYRELIITQPRNNEIFANNAQGKLVVAMDIQPALQGEDRVQLIMDGTVQAVQTTPIFNLTNIDRGTHVVQEQILDNQNKVLASSAMVTFTMQRPKVQRITPAPKH